MSLFKKKTLGKTQPKVTRTAQEMQQEYNNLVAMVGDREYKIRLNQKQIDHANNEILELMEKIDELQAEGAKQREKEQADALASQDNTAMKEPKPA